MLCRAMGHWRAKSEFWVRVSPLGVGRDAIHPHRPFGYIAAQFGAADDAMLVDQVLRVTTAAHGFREPHHTNPLDLAPLLDRGELDPEGAELVDFLLGDLEAVFVEISEPFQLAFRQVEIGRASGRERGCQFVTIWVAAVLLKKKQNEQKTNR